MYVCEERLCEEEWVEFKGLSPCMGLGFLLCKGFDVLFISDITCISNYPVRVSLLTSPSIGRSR